MNKKIRDRDKPANERFDQLKCQAFINWCSQRWVHSENWIIATKPRNH